MAVSTINERIKAVRKTLGISQRDFCGGIYLSHSFFVNIDTGARNSNHRVTELICTKYKANKDWLLTGKGDMFSETPPDMELLQLTEIIKELDPIFRDCIIKQIHLMANLHRKSKEVSVAAPRGDKPGKKRG
jgi:transcriptional regulator with XRE-family HTH domain